MQLSGPGVRTSFLTRTPAGQQPEALGWLQERCRGGAWKKEKHPGEVRHEVVERSEQNGDSGCNGESKGEGSGNGEGKER